MGKFNEQVQVMSACGLSVRGIAKELGLTESELQSQYREDLDHGLEVANAKVAKTFYDLAVSGEFPQITAKWMELRAGWASTSNLNVKDDTDAEVAREKLLKLMNRSTPTKLTKVK